MTRDILAAIAVLVLTVAIAGTTAATPPSAQPVASDWTWQQVVPTTAGLSEASHDPAPVPAAATEDARPEGASTPAAPSTEPTAAAASMPEPTPGAVAPSAAPGATRQSVTGTASWYCRVGVSACTRGYPASGLYAAAGPALRVGNWRGRYVTVNGLRVRLIDWCACPGGRVIDLYSSAFARLAPLSRGTINVEVRW